MNQVQQAQFLSTGHIILILAAILLLFGGKKIPELMKGLGQGMKEFKDASKSNDSTKEGESKKESTTEEK
jgi:sec-independent protein translocase protein TatA